MSRAPVLAALLLAQASACVAPAGTEPMWRHFDAVRDAHEAVIQGDIETARAAGATVASWRGSYGDLPDDADDLLADMRHAGRLAASAPDLTAAALAAAEMGRICGDCHSRYDAGPRFQGRGLPPEEGTGVRLGMKVHAWGATRLWEGLVGPSDSSWVAGARVLVHAPMLIDSLTDREYLLETARALENNVHGVASAALDVTDSSERARLYSNFILTCAACHTRIRDGLSPGSHRSSHSPGPGPAPREKRGTSW
jgi:hypothetical protein